jgi:tetratricopeptide (TPR) repeat protein
MTATPVVGREAELEQLDRQLERALHGHSATCFVTGEPGAGKSSLAMEFARRAQQRAPELLVTYGTCDAYTGTGDAYLPFREVLLQLTGDVERSLAAGRTSHEGARRLETFALFAGRALVENGADLVGLFVPGGSLLTRLGTMAVRRQRWAQQVHEKLYGGGSAQPAARMMQQENVFEQYTQVLEAMSSERPLLILIDDLHWADVASIGLLFHLSRRLVNARLMIVGVYRSEEVARPRDGKPHPLQGVVAELMRLHADLPVIDLDKLRARSFIDALVDARPNRLDERFRDSLARHTAGNPLFAVELLQSLQASGALAESSTGTVEQVSAIEWKSLPSRVAGVIESRTALLTAQQKEILAAASVQGEEFVADVVAELLRIERRDVVRELSGPMQKALRLVTAVGMQEAGGRLLARYRFRHNLVQDYLYRQLDEIERAELHGATGLALERIHEHDPAPVAVALATHFTAAGDWSRAIRYRLIAGETAARAFGHDEAVEHLEQALALGERHPLVGDTAMDRGAVHERLGDERLLVRKWAPSVASFNASLALIAPAARTVRARLLRKLARVAERQSQYAEAVRHLDAAQAELAEPDEADPSAWWHEWIEIQIALSFVYYWQGDIVGIDATDARLAPVIEDRGTPIQRSQFYAARARRGLRQTRYWPDAAAIDSAERAVGTLDAYPDEPLQSETVFLLAFTQLWSERFVEAHESFERAIAVSRRFGDSTHRLRSLVYGSVGERRLGHVEEVERLVDEANDLMRQLDSDEYMPVILAQNVWLAWRRGDDARARALLEELLPVSRQRISRFPFHWLLLWVQVAMHAAAGDVADAADTAAAMLQPPLSRQRDEVEQHLRRISAARGGDPAELKRELELGLEAARAAGYL